MSAERGQSLSLVKDRPKYNGHPIVQERPDFQLQPQPVDPARARGVARQLFQAEQRLTELGIANRRQSPDKLSDPAARRALRLYQLIRHTFPRIAEQYYDAENERIVSSTPHSD